MVYERWRKLRKLDTICGDSGLGLLFAIPATSKAPFHVTLDEYMRFTNDEVTAFRDLILLSDTFCKTC